MKRSTRKRRSPAPTFPAGKFIPVQAIKVNRNGTIDVAVRDKDLPKRLRRASSRNIMAGFYDEEGIFHPIRASADYDPGRSGERHPARGKKGKKRK